jgi:hypothetical protein
VSGPGLTLIDATYAYGFGRLEGKLPPDTFGGYPVGLLLDRLQRRLRQLGTGQQHYRDQGILSYEFMIANDQSGPYSWWESSTAPSASPWIGPSPGRRPGIVTRTRGASPKPTRSCSTRWWRRDPTAR